jgi:hypothetical protein
MSRAALLPLLGVCALSLTGLVLLGSSATVAHSAPSCGPASSRTVAEGRGARIYFVSRPPRPDRPRLELHACWGARSIFLPELVGPFFLQPPWVAGIRHEVSGVDVVHVSIFSESVDTGRSRSCVVGAGDRPRNRPVVDAAVLKPNGSLAWIGKTTTFASRGRVPAVGSCDSTGDHALDSGAGINLHSLRLRGSKLTWTDGTEQRSTVLR